MNVPLPSVKDFEFEGMNATWTLMRKFIAAPTTYRA